MRINFRVRWIIILLAGLFILFGYLVLFSTSAEGGADNYAHFRLARYAFKYPQIFLDHWGKPLFTILSSPFAQFGFKGIQFFNVVAGLLTALFTYLIVRKFEYKNSWLIIIFTCFTPIYFIVMQSGLTEILFSLVLVLSTYLFFEKKFIASAIVISFIIFSRTEGIVVIPFFISAYIIERKFKAIPFLLSGFIFFSILGFFILGDFWWFITQNPYTGAKDIYGSGELTHFISNTKRINGIPLAILLGIGLISYIRDFFRKSKRTKQVANELILVLIVYVAYLAAHSVAWWKGVGGSLGLIRVTAAVMPLAAIVSLRGFNFLYDGLKFNQFVQLIFKGIVLILVIKVPYDLYHLPVKEDKREEIITEASAWIKTNNLTNNKIYYYDPYFIHQLGIDPFDQQLCAERIPDIVAPGENMPEGSILQWDAHFGPNEGKLPLDSLLNNPKFKILHVFKPEEPFTVLNGFNYEVYIFQRINQN